MQNNWIKSLAVNMVILLLVLVTTNLMYETNDDYAIAARIADGYPYVNFINYYLCRILIPMQQSADFNVYVIFQIAAAFASFVFVLKVLLDSCRNIHVTVVAVLVILIPVWSDCDRKYDSIQGRIMPENISRFINSHEDSMFIFPVSEKKNSPDYAYPVSIPGNSGLKNVMGTGSWGTLSQYILNKLAQYGMENLVKDLINRTNAY